VVGGNHGGPGTIKILTSNLQTIPKNKKNKTTHTVIQNFKILILLCTYIIDLLFTIVILHRRSIRQL